MESVPVEKEALPQALGPAGFDELEVAGFLETVESVAHDGMTAMRKMHPDLMHPPGLGNTPEKGKPVPVPFESTEDRNPRSAGASPGVDHLFEPDPGGFHFTAPPQGSIHFPVFLLRPVPCDGVVFLVDGAVLERFGKLTRRRRMFGHDHDSAGVAVQPGDHGKSGAIGDLISQKTFQTVEERGRVSRLAGMTKQMSGLIDDDPVGALVEDRKLRIEEKTAHRSCNVIESKWSAVTI